MKRNPIRTWWAIKALSIISNIIRVADFIVKYAKPIKDFFATLMDNLV